MINRGGNITYFGEFNSYCYLAYIFSLCLTYLCTFKGVSQTGQIAVYTGSLPFFFLVILILRGLFLEGSWIGRLFYLLYININSLKFKIR